MLHHGEYKIGFVLDQSAMFSIMGQKKGVPRKHQVKPLKVIWDKLTQFGPHSISFNSYGIDTIHIDDLSRNFAMNPKQGLKIAPFKNAPVSRETDRELKDLTR
jgi:ubiquitin-like domain-containing CTD phosphatase 1